MSRQTILILFLVGFGAGIFLRSFFEIYWTLAALAGISGIFFLIFSHLDVKRPNYVFLALAVFLVSLGLGILRYEIKDAVSISQELQSKIGQNVFLRGMVVDEPDERENNSRLIFEAEETKDRILIIAPLYPEFSYGDILKIEGRLEKPENFNDFDYRAYLAKDEIFLEMFYPQIQKLESGRGWWLKSALFGLKAKYLKSLSQILPEPQAALVAGLTVGARRSIPQEILEDFRKVGVIHIVVLSGYNVTIVARAVASFFATFLPYFLSTAAGLIGIFLFAILTGATATVVRASIMAAILYFAGLTGRIYQAKIALFAAGFLMLIFNPKILRFDLSFQLSFLATLGLLYLSPHLERFVKWLPKILNLREYGLATLSAQLAVMPLLLYNMGTFSIVALPANLLILIAVPATMLFGFLTGVAAWLHPWFAAPFSWLTFLLSSYALKIAELFAQI